MHTTGFDNDLVKCLWECHASFLIVLDRCRLQQKFGPISRGSTPDFTDASDSIVLYSKNSSVTAVTIAVEILKQEKWRRGLCMSEPANLLSCGRASCRNRAGGNLLEAKHYCFSGHYGRDPYQLELRKNEEGIHAGYGS
jgi:hypothetical protein